MFGKIIEKIIAWVLGKKGFEPDNKQGYTETEGFKKVNRTIWNMGSLVKLLIRLFIFLFMLTIVILGIYIVVYQTINHQDTINVFRLL
jgi:hypothetical protein